MNKRSEKLGTPTQCRAEEKRILSMAGQIDRHLNGLQDLDTLSMKQVKELLTVATLLAGAVLHRDTEIIVHDA